MLAPKHPKQDHRLAVLKAFAILDTSPETDFDNITALMSKLCDVPVCLISLVDKERQWFKSEIGLCVRETPLDQSICSHVILQEEYDEIHDTRLDPRTSRNPLCKGMKPFRFYAGAPLMAGDGSPLGTLCVLDYVPRTMTDLQREALQTHASLIIRLMELRISKWLNRRLQEAQTPPNRLHS